MLKLDRATSPEIDRTGYPPPHNATVAVAERRYRRLSLAVELADFGVSRVTPALGAWSSQRHWDEVLVIVSGKAVLIEDRGETQLSAGACAAVPTGVADAHHLVDRGREPCAFIVVDGGTAMGRAYSDIDMVLTADGRCLRRNGSSLEAHRV